MEKKRTGRRKKLIKFDLDSFVRVTGALLSAEDVKARLDVCEKNRRKGVCACGNYELCTIALAAAIGVTSATIASIKHNLIEPLAKENVFVIRRIKAPNNQPRVFVSLNNNWRDNFVDFVEKRARIVLLF